MSDDEREKAWSGFVARRPRERLVCRPSFYAGWDARGAEVERRDIRICHLEQEAEESYQLQLRLQRDSNALHEAIRERDDLRARLAAVERERDAARLAAETQTSWGEHWQAEWRKEHARAGELEAAARELVRVDHLAIDLDLSRPGCMELLLREALARREEEKP